MTVGVECAPATSAAELAAHHAIRHEVFVTEQAVFSGDDRDGHDGAPGTVAILGRWGGVPAGTVRLFPLEDVAGRWQGDRLAVLPAYRVHGVGAPLVRCAVATAGLHGGSQMVAHVQLPNVGFFRRLGWTAVGAVETYAGLPHQLMVIAVPSPVVAGELLGALAVG